MRIAAEADHSIEATRREAHRAAHVSAGRFAHISPDLYRGLRRLAHQLMRGERGGHTLQPTAILNEAFLRLSNSNVQAQDSLHLYRLVARTMRRILVDYARERSRMKRNAAYAAPELSNTIDTCASSHSPTPLDVLDIDAALSKLAEKSPRAAELLELRYFAGVEELEIGEMYSVSKPTVERELRFARAFLLAYAKQRQGVRNDLRST